MNAKTEPTKRGDVFTEARNLARKLESLDAQKRAAIENASPEARALVEALQKIPNGLDALAKQPTDPDFDDPNNIDHVDE